MTKKLAFSIILLSFTFLVTLLILNMANAKLGLAISGGNLSFCLLLFAVCSLLYMIRVDVSSGRHLESESILFTLSCVPTFLCTLSHVDDTYGALALLTLPLGLFLGKQLCRNHIKSKHPDLFLSIILLPAFVLWAHLATIALKSPKTIVSGRDCMFYICMFAPLLYHYRNYVLRTCTILLFTLLIIISAKRSLLIAILLTTCIYYARFVFEKKIPFWKKNIYITSCLCLIFIFVMNVNISEVSNQGSFSIMIDRMSNMNDQSNQQRGYIYEIIFNEYINSPFLNIVFGHGCNAVAKNIFGHPAHNDILELLYDYGLCGTLFYALFYIKATLLLLKSIGSRMCAYSDYVYLFITLVLILILSMGNCIATNPIINLFLIICLGWNTEFIYNKK